MRTPVFVTVLLLLGALVVTSMLGMGGMDGMGGGMPMMGQGQGQSASGGEAIYKQFCATCHGADGKGALPGAPDFTDPGGRLSKSDEVLLKHMLEGFQSPGSPMAMPPKGGNPGLSVDELRATLAYIRERFGK